MNRILEKIQKIGIVPVVVLDDPKDAAPLAEALCKGGLPCAEVTFRTAAAEESIRIMTECFPDMLAGAGTVLTIEQADRARAAGARFIVSPGLNPAVVRHCMEIGIPVIPGTATPSDVEAAMGLGLDVVKFFPAEQAGGIAMIKAMSAPFPMFKIMPTGGISLKNLREYLSCPVVAACGGSYMVTADLIDHQKFDEITALCRQSAEIIQEVRHHG